MEKRGIVWDYNIEVVKAFIGAYGRAPKYKEKVNGIEIGKFWSTAKCQSKKGVLPADRRAQVNYILNNLL